MNSTGPHPDLCGLTVLVVEDDADNRELLRVALQSHGADVVEAEEVMTAQAYVRQLKVDLVVTDLALPGRDGASFLKWVRGRLAAVCRRSPSPPSTSGFRPPSSPAGRPTSASRWTRINW
jgi:CheY-like chemotaxis protein